MLTLPFVRIVLLPVVDAKIQPTELVFLALAPLALWRYGTSLWPQQRWLQVGLLVYLAANVAAGLYSGAVPALLEALGRIYLVLLALIVARWVSERPAARTEQLLRFFLYGTAALAACTYVGYALALTGDLNAMVQVYGNYPYLGTVLRAKGFTAGAGMLIIVLLLPTLYAWRGWRNGKLSPWWFVVLFPLALLTFAKEVLLLCLGLVLIDPWVRERIFQRGGSSGKATPGATRYRGRSSGKATPGATRYRGRSSGKATPGATRYRGRSSGKATPGATRYRGRSSGAATLGGMRYRGRGMQWLLVGAVAVVFWLGTHYIVQERRPFAETDLAGTNYTAGNIVWSGETLQIIETSYTELKKAGVSVAAQYPWFGVGPGQFGRALPAEKAAGRYPTSLPDYDPHCTWLGAWSETGVFGLLGLLLLMFAFGQILYQEANSIPLSITIFLLLILIMSVSKDVMNFRFLWLALGLVLGNVPRENFSAR